MEMGNVFHLTRPMSRSLEDDNSSIATEQALLGAVLTMPDSLQAIAGILSPEHFCEPLHQRLFTALVDRLAKGAPADARLLAGDFGAEWHQQIAEGVTLGAYIARLMTVAAPPVILRSYASDLRDAWALRTVCAAAAEAHADTGMPGDRLSTILAATDEVRASMAERSGSRQSAGATADELLAKVNARRMGEPAPIGATTGWPALDKVMGGYLPGQLIVLAGRPGMGKTTAASSSAWQCSAAGNGVLYFSLEMGADPMGARLLADISYRREQGIAYSWIGQGELNDVQMERILRAGERLKTLPLEMDFSGRLSVADISARILSAKRVLARRGVNLRVVFIDYLKMVTAGDRYRGNRVYEIGEITAGLRAVAKEHGVCVVLLAQLNRGVEAREDKRPLLSDLRESGDIEADADAVLFTYREAYYLTATGDYADGKPEALARFDQVRDRMEIIAAKNRNGATVTVELTVDIASSAVREPGSANL